MDDVTRLESIAQQLIARLRDDDPQANLRWLRAELGLDPLAPVTDTERLLFVGFAAVPTDRTWKQLTAWTRPPGVGTPLDSEKRRRMRRVA